MKCDSECYEIDGILYPRITSVLATLHNPELHRWRESIGADKANAYRDEAAESGSKLHDIFHRLSLGEGLDETLEESEVAKIRGWQNWVNDLKPKFIETEKTVWLDDPNRAAGTMDALVDIDGEPYVIDYKTGSKIYYEHELQICFYGMAAVARNLVHPFPKLGILHLKDSTKSGYQFKLVEPDLDAVDSLLYLYWKKNKSPRPLPRKIHLTIQAEGSQQ